MYLTTPAVNNNVGGRAVGSALADPTLFILWCQESLLAVTVVFHSLSEDFYFTYQLLISALAVVGSPVTFALYPIYYKSLFLLYI